MSEPLSSVEIEDVLSSIRRLVSDDLRPVYRPTPHPAAFRPLDSDRPAPRGTDRLILTPALRVVPAAESPTKTVIAALELAVEAQGEPWESETGDVAPAAAGGNPSDSIANFGSKGLGWDDDVFDVALARAVRAKQDAAPPATVLESIRTSLPEDVAVQASDGNDGRHASWKQDEESGAERAFEPSPVQMAAPADPVWVAQAEAEVLASLADDAAVVTEVFTSRRRAPPAEPDDDDAITFDEEVLRDLVRDLIREELQGALGERITRNVRKLVRAEIARTIAAESYE